MLVDREPKLGGHDEAYNNDIHHRLDDHTPEHMDVSESRDSMG